MGWILYYTRNTRRLPRVLSLNSCCCQAQDSQQAHLFWLKTNFQYFFFSILLQCFLSTVSLSYRLLNKKGVCLHFTTFVLFVYFENLFPKKNKTKKLLFRQIE